MLTQAILKELLHYDPETGLFTRLVKAKGPQCRVGDVVGSIDGSGYTHIRIDKQRPKAHRLAYLYMTGEWPSAQLDHINGDRKDNRWVNLRPVTNAENQRNVALKTNNVSGVCGVFWDTAHQKWRARINVGGVGICLGRYTNIEDAAEARRAANVKYGFHEGHGRARS